MRILSRLGGVRPCQQMADGASRWFSLVEVDTIDDELLVDGMREGAAHANIVERLARVVRDQDVLADRSARASDACDNGDAWRVAQAISVGAGHAADVVDFSFFKRRD